METIVASLSAFDAFFLEFFHEVYLTAGNICTPIVKVLNIIGDLPLLLIGWLGFALFFILKDKKCGMWMCGSVIIGAILVTIILKNLIYRPRPYVDSQIYQAWWQAFNLWPNWDTSFPSGHACAAMSGTFAFFMWSRKKYISWLAFLYPLIMGASRVYLCVHYPTDVVAGYIIGMLSAIICIPFVKLFYWFFRKYPDLAFSRYCLTGETKKSKKKKELNKK